MSTKDSLRRLKQVKEKLAEYEGLNESVFEVLENHEKMMHLRNLSDIDDKTSIFSQDGDVSPIAIGGVKNLDPSFGEGDNVVAATGSSSNHRRAKSRPYLYKQKSDARKMHILNLEKNLQEITRRSPSFSKMNSSPNVIMQGRKTLKETISAQNFDKQECFFSN